jgi:hypothetical protein
MSLPASHWRIPFGCYARNRDPRQGVACPDAAMASAPFAAEVYMLNLYIYARVMHPAAPLHARLQQPRIALPPGAMNDLQRRERHGKKRGGNAGLWSERVSWTSRNADPANTTLYCGIPRLRQHTGSASLPLCHCQYRSETCRKPLITRQDATRSASRPQDARRHA